MLFDSPGKSNTDQTLAAAVARAKALGITELVLASTTGETAIQAAAVAAGMSVTAVTYHCGFKRPFEPSMAAATRQRLEELGVRVVMATHALSGVERAIAKKHGGVSPAMVMADTLKLFGQGVKVAVEVAIMAADAGALSGADIVAIGGSSKGADAALVIKPAHMNNLFDLKIREIICKPWDF